MMLIHNNKIYNKVNNKILILNNLIINIKVNNIKVNINNKMIFKMMNQNCNILKVLRYKNNNKNK